GQRRWPMHAPGVTRFELPRLPLSAPVELGREIGASREASRCLEEVAACVVGTLRDRFVDERDELASVLVRFYKTACFEQLAAGLRAIGRGILGEARPDRDMRCLPLLATAGEEPEWNDRARSRRHQCIPLPSGERVAAMPMIAQLLRQLGVDLR